MNKRKLNNYVKGSCSVTFFETPQIPYYHDFLGI